MIVKASNVSAALRTKDHRQPAIVKALRWFWRFSQFYGEYVVRSPKDRQIWVDQQRIRSTTSKG